MPLDLGDLIPFSFTVRDSTGAPINPSTNTLTVTAPDGTTTTPATVSGGVGILNRDEPAIMAGLYAGRLVTTGPVAATVQTFYVEDNSSPPVVSVAETKNLMRITTTDPAGDELLRWHIDVATDIAEGFLSTALRRQTIVEKYDGSTAYLMLRSGPVISITSVVENAASLTATDYTLDTYLGALYRGAPQYASTGSRWWLPGRQNVTVTYLVGPANGVITTRIRHGIMAVAAHLWGQQRGGSNLPRQDQTTPQFPLPLTVTNQAGTGYWDYDQTPGVG